MTQAFLFNSEHKKKLSCTFLIVSWLKKVTFCVVVYQKFKFFKRNYVFKKKN